jgi:hypothetical protein
MNSNRFSLALVCLVFSARVVTAQPAITVYNQNFGVVRETVPIELKKGETTVSYSEATAHIEPDSIVLRDPAGKTAFTILEQTYRNDPVTQSLLLSLFEGQVIDFLVRQPNKPDELIRGKVIRSGYQPVWHTNARYGRGGTPRQMEEPIIEVEGKLRFSLPGQPLFPSLGDDTILKPTLTWRLHAEADAKLEAELAYVTGGMSWNADYNVVAPETGDTIDLTGWVTMDNQTGRTFQNARIKLMAGDVQKLAPGRADMDFQAGFEVRARKAAGPQVTERTFDEYHLYTLERPVTLRDQETKQVEFIRAENVTARRIYVYDGASLNSPRYRGWDPAARRTQPDYGTESNTKVWVMREFMNNADNNLGIPLPAGRLRFYRRDADGRLEFVGENEIDHTPKDELVRVYTGNAFDLTGERKRTDFKVSNANDWADESFEITLKNHKEEPVEIRVVESLYRWTNWEIVSHSLPFEKKEAQRIEFKVPLNPGETKVLTYKVHYSW